MADWINMSFVIDDATPNIATLTINSVVLTLVYDSGSVIMTGITEPELYQSTGGMLAAVMRDALGRFMSGYGEAAGSVSIVETIPVWDIQVLDPILVELETQDGYVPPQNPLEIEVVETSTGPYASSDVVSFDITVTNNTGVDLTDVELAAGVSGANTLSTGSPVSLLDTASTVLTRTYTVAAADVGTTLFLTANVSGTDISLNEYTSYSIIHQIDTPPVLIILDVVETTTPPYAATLAPVSFDLTITNNSGVTISDINISAVDDGGGSLSVGSLGMGFTLAHGASTTITIDYFTSGETGDVTITIDVDALKPDLSPVLSETEIALVDIV